MTTIRQNRINRFANDNPLTIPQLNALLETLAARGIGHKIWQMIVASGILTKFLDVVAKGTSLDGFVSLLEVSMNKWHGRGIVIGEEDVVPDTLFSTYPGLPDPRQEEGFWNAATENSIGTFHVKLRRLVDSTLPAFHVPLRVDMPMTEGFAPATLVQILAYSSQAFEDGRPVPEKILVPSCAYRSDARPGTYAIPIMVTEFPSPPRVIYRACQIGADGSFPDYCYDSYKPEIPFWVAEAAPID